jgi:hypothetical protein
MVKWRHAAYIGLVVFPTFVLAPGCGEPADPPPETSEEDVDDVEGVGLDFDDEIDAPSTEPGEPSDSNDQSEPEGDAQSSESGE